MMPLTSSRLSARFHFLHSTAAFIVLRATSRWGVWAAVTGAAHEAAAAQSSWRRTFQYAEAIRPGNFAQAADAVADYNAAVTRWGYLAPQGAPVARTIA